jgi:hypothetical protein
LLSWAEMKKSISKSIFGGNRRLFLLLLQEEKEAVDGLKS